MNTKNNRPKRWGLAAKRIGTRQTPVSYTHLDVYKRQSPYIMNMTHYNQYCDNPQNKQFTFKLNQNYLPYPFTFA